MKTLHDKAREFIAIVGGGPQDVADYQLVDEIAAIAAAVRADRELNLSRAMEQARKVNR